MTADGPVGQRMRSMGTRVTCLNMPQGRLSTKGLWQLWRIISNRRPEVVQTWLYHADLLGGVMAALAGVPCICWNIRNTNLDAEKTRWHTRQVVRACALISSVVPSLILCNSYRSAQEHRGRGYAPKNSVSSLTVLTFSTSTETLREECSFVASLDFLIQIR